MNFMKRLIVLLVLLLAVSFVFAQEDNSILKKIDTLEIKDNVVKTGIEERNALKLVYNGTESIIHVKELDEVSNSAQLLIFVGKSEAPYYLTLSKKLTIKLDVEKDNKDDLAIIFDSIKDNKLNIIIEKIKDKIEDTTNETAKINDVLKEVLKDETKNADLKLGIIISLIIIIGGSLIFIAFKPRKKSEV